MSYVETIEEKAEVAISMQHGDSIERVYDQFGKLFDMRGGWDMYQWSFDRADFQDDGVKIFLTGSM